MQQLSGKKECKPILTSELATPCSWVNVGGVQANVALYKGNRELLFKALLDLVTRNDRVPWYINCSSKSQMRFSGTKKTGNEIVQKQQ